MHCDAIIFDLDGTAVENAGDKPSAAVREAIQSRQSQIVLCAATGRSWVEAKSVIKALALQRPVILCGGALIIDPTTESILWQAAMPAATAQAVLNVATDFEYAVLYTQGLATSEPQAPHQVKIDAPTTIMYILDVPEDHQDFELLIKALRTIPRTTLTMARAWGLENGIDLHITSEQASKEHAVIELCDMLKLDRARVAGVGDGQNDIHLFNAVGHKIAMGNAVPELKEAADRVIQSVEDDGLAQLISEIVRQG